MEWRRNLGKNVGNMLKVFAKYDILSPNLPKKGMKIEMIKKFLLIGFI